MRINFKSVIGALWGYTCTREMTLTLFNCFQIHFPKITLTLFQGEIIYAPPPPPPPISGQKAFFRRGGWGCIFWGATRQEFYTPPPLFYTPPTFRRVFSGVGGWGCIKFGPVILSKIITRIKFSWNFLGLFECFLLVLQGFWGFARWEKSLVFLKFSLVFSKRPRKTSGQGKLHLHLHFY